VVEKKEREVEGCCVRSVGLGGKLAVDLLLIEFSASVVRIQRGDTEKRTVDSVHRDRVAMPDKGTGPGDKTGANKE